MKRGLEIMLMPHKTGILLQLLYAIWSLFRRIVKQRTENHLGGSSSGWSVEGTYYE